MLRDHLPLYVGAVYRSIRSRNTIQPAILWCTRTLNLQDRLFDHTMSEGSPRLGRDPEINPTIAAYSGHIMMTRADLDGRALSSPTVCRTLHVRTRIVDRAGAQKGPSLPCVIPWTARENPPIRFYVITRTNASPTRS